MNGALKFFLGPLPPMPWMRWRRLVQVRKSRGGPYPPDWDQIAQKVKEDSGWCCVRCGIPNQPGHVLTVHHLDMNPANCAWFNLLALCQQCHLQIQHKVVIEQPWMFDHSEWFKIYAAGYYAHRAGLPTDKQYVMDHLDWLLELGRPQSLDNCA